MSTLTPKPVDFKFSEYLNKGFELFKKDMGTFIVAFLFAMIFSIIPIFSFLAAGNFIKLARKINQGEQVSATEIFNFDDFMVYFKLFLILLAAILVIQLPIFFLMPKPDESGMATSADFPAGFMIFFFAFIVVLYYFLLKAYYIIPLISLENVKSLKEAWSISSVMTSGNLLVILGFALVVGIIGELGVLACFVGLFFTLPLTYVLQYVSYEDGINQIKS